MKIEIDPKFLEHVIELLNDVRTGTDFEAECWEAANELQEVLEANNL